MYMAMFKWTSFTEDGYSSSAAKYCILYLQRIITIYASPLKKIGVAVCEVSRVRILDSKYSARGERFDRSFCLTLQLSKRTDKRCLPLVASHLHLSRVE